MIYTFTLTRQAHFHAVQDATKRTLAHKVIWGVFVVLALLVALLAGFSGQGIARAYAASGPYLIVYLLILLLGLPLAQWWTVSQMHRHNRALRDPQTCELTPDFLIMRGPLFNAQIRWEAIYKVVETRRTILFYVSKGMAHFLPKNVIPPSDIAALRQSLSTWVPGRAELRSGNAAA